MLNPTELLIKHIATIIAVLSNILIKFEQYYIKQISKWIIIVRSVKRSSDNYTDGFGWRSRVNSKVNISFSSVGLSEITAAQLKTKHSVLINTRQWSAVMKEWACGVLIMARIICLIGVITAAQRCSAWNRAEVCF